MYHCALENITGFSRVQNWVMDSDGSRTVSGSEFKRSGPDRQNFFVHIALSYSKRWWGCLALLNVNDSNWRLLQLGCITRRGRWVQTDVDTYIRAHTSYTRFSVNWQPVQEVTNISSDVIESLLPQYDTRCWTEYILQWPEVNCADTVQDAVAVINPAGDEGVYHGISSCFRQWPSYSLQVSQVVETLTGHMATCSANVSVLSSSTARHMATVDTLITTHTHTHTHTRLMALCPGLPGWASTRKVKPIWILVKQETVSGSGIGWTVCKSAPRSRQITTPTPHCSVFYRPDALPAAQPTASKHWRQWVVLERSLKSSWILKLQFSARHVYAVYDAAEHGVVVSVELIDQLSVAVCSAHKDNLWWQEFCCQWTSRVEQFTCGTAFKWRHGGDFQKTAEDISV